MDIGDELYGEFLTVLLMGWGLEFIIGTSAKLKDAAIGSRMYHVFIYGHTHIKEEGKVGGTIVLNPGTAHKKSQEYFGCFSGRRDYGFWYPNKRNKVWSSTITHPFSNLIEKRVFCRVVKTEK